MIPREDITGIVLCGGEGHRMGGRDKPLEHYGGEPLAAHVVRRLAPQVVRVVISCSRNPDRYTRLCRSVVVDDVPGLGPLGGLCSSLAGTTTAYAFVCPGDAPLLSMSLVETLAHAWRGDTIDACVPFDGTRTQHLFVLLRVALRDRLTAYLEDGGRSVHRWLETQNVQQLDVSFDPDSFRNVNSPEDLRRLNARFAQESCR